MSHIYAQVIDDMTGTTVASAASTEPALKTTFAGATRGGNIAGAKALGKTIAERLIAKGIKRVVFDRGGFLYHGRIKRGRGSGARGGAGVLGSCQSQLSASSSWELALQSWKLELETT